MTRLQNYDIYFYNTAGVRVFLLQIFEYLEFHQRVNDSWNLVLRLSSGSEDTDLLTFFRETLTRDFVLEIYRTDEVTGDRDLVYEGFHRTLVDQVKQSGVVVFTLYGVGYTELLKRRIVLPPTGQEHNSKTGIAETIIKEFVDDEAVSAADTNRIIPGLTIEADAGLGSTAEYSARYTNLYTVIIRCAEQGGVDFGIIKDSSVGTFVFEVRELWGDDKSSGNADGNPPIVFDLYAGNMVIPIFSKNGGDEVNFVYIGGQQQGINRVIETRQNATAIAVSPWNRRELFVDARNESSSAGLQTIGQSTLTERGYIESITFNVQQTPGVRWIRDWVLGDIITARYAGQEFDKKIVEVAVTISAGETGATIIENISAEMEDV